MSVQSRESLAIAALMVKPRNPARVMLDYMLSRGVPVECSHLHRVIAARLAISEELARQTADALINEGTLRRDTADNGTRDLYRMADR